MKVTILMSTYNGENFLAEQIESIQQQTYTDWTLLIRDDGSKDKTRDLSNVSLQKMIALFSSILIKLKI